MAAAAAAAVPRAAAATGGSFPAFTWPNEPPPDIPFERSGVFTEVEFAGRFAAYGGADTWFPTWAADGRLFTPWTDGRVGSARAASGCAGSGCLSSTGFATVAGDNALNLTVLGAGTASASPSPYHGRYPCGSLVYRGVWFYGTYALDNEDHAPGAARRGPGGPGGAGYCGNWCVLGPFLGFRWSADEGRTWTEPHARLRGYADSLFGEAAPDNHTRKVRFGAPHVVDLGRELEHRPSGDAEPRLYIVAHGASRAASPNSWMQGSEVHLARVAPTVAAVQDRLQWEFYAGAGRWVRGDVHQARPLLAWANRTGVTTMTYLPAVKRYIVCISTPTVSPFTRGRFDTYLLESPSITGPFRYITYMRAFGPQAYFVNVPSKFAARAVDPEDGSLSLFLSYSANFAMAGAEANPPGSGYHWALQEVRLRPPEGRGHGRSEAGRVLV